jgi:mRNA interferase HigB
LEGVEMQETPHNCLLVCATKIVGTSPDLLRVQGVGNRRNNQYLWIKKIHFIGRSLMNTISYRRIREFAAKHPEAESSLSAWYKIAKKAKWQNLAKVKEDYPHADLVGGFTVFNISGNKYRLIAKIDYQSQLILIKYIFTHAEYSKDKWKKN